MACVYFFNGPFLSLVPHLHVLVLVGATSSSVCHASPWVLDKAGTGGVKAAGRRGNPTGMMAGGNGKGKARRENPHQKEPDHPLAKW